MKDMLLFAFLWLTTLPSFSPCIRNSLLMSLQKYVIWNLNTGVDFYSTFIVYFYILAQMYTFIVCRKQQKFLNPSSKGNPTSFILQRNLVIFLKMKERDLAYLYLYVAVGMSKSRWIPYSEFLHNIWHTIQYQRQVQIWPNSIPALFQRWSFKLNP